MNKIAKIAILFLGVIFFSWIFILIFYDYPQDSFSNIKIPKNLNFDKPIESLTNRQIDSLENKIVNEEEILVIGNGYNGYEFYVWHKPTELGTLYIKAFELTQNIQLSKEKLTSRTSHQINQLDTKFNLYKSKTVIDEGTFEKYYPVRFELWFKPKASDDERKVKKVYYVIDGWDR